MLTSSVANAWLFCKDIHRSLVNFSSQILSWLREDQTAESSSSAWLHSNAYIVYVHTTIRSHVCSSMTALSFQAVMMVESSFSISRQVSISIPFARHELNDCCLLGQFIRELAEPCEAVWRVTFRDDKCVILCKRNGKTVRIDISPHT